MGIANLGDEIMKRKIFCTLMITAACLVIAGCSGKESDETTSSIFEAQTETSSTSEEVQNADAQSSDTTEEVASDDGRVSICDETTELDYSKDYAEEIKVAVERAVAEASSFEDEFNKMSEIQDHITARRSSDQTQYEMNMASLLYFQVWDAELNNLWNRFSETVDAQTKERVLADQRCWNSMKEEAALEALGPREEGGSIYPLLYNGYMEESTKVRCYVLAKEIAAAKGESYTMPSKAATGSYIDNQGTDSVYSSLSVTSGWESGYDVKVSLYRVGEIEGTAVEESDGNLTFTSSDESIKGIIHYGWDGATFEVTEAGDGSIVSVGEKFEFPFVF